MVQVSELRRWLKPKNISATSTYAPQTDAPKRHCRSTAEQQDHSLSFEYTGQNDDEAFDMAFNKKRADDRKDATIERQPSAA